MKAKINGKILTVNYIDYGFKDIPHTVFTTDEKGYTAEWDFFANNGNGRDIRFYHAGSGCHHSKIRASNWAMNHIGKYWLSPESTLKGKSNGIKLKAPIRLKGWSGGTSINPFNIAEETHSREYCEECGHESTEFCYKHKYEDDEGNERWIHNNEYSG